MSTLHCTVPSTASQYSQQSILELLPNLKYSSNERQMLKGNPQRNFVIS